jgi:hypothetical protein
VPHAVEEVGDVDGEDVVEEDGEEEEGEEELDLRRDRTSGHIDEQNAAE